MCLDVHPRSFSHIGTPAVDLWITEGVRKADSLLSHGTRCVVALSGVWNWRGSNEKGGTTALSDWESIALKGRNVYLVFDSDADRNPKVENARDRLANFLRGRGANVIILYLPDGESGKKVGVDDYLAAGNSLEKLKTLTKPPELPGVEEDKFQGIPHGFRIKEGGLYALEIKEDDDGNPREREIRIGAPLIVEALVRDKKSEDWGRVLRFTDPDGIPHVWVCPATLLGADTSDFHRELARLGYILASGQKSKRLLEDFVKLSSPKARIRCVPKIGWYEDVFVLPDETFGNKGPERILFQSETTDHLFLTSGTVEEWRDNIGKLCAGNSRLIFAISTAFAAPLLHLGGVDSGVNHFFGASSTGKTSLIQVSTSVYGSRDYVRSWRTTDNGLEGVLAGLNDCLSVFDELGQSDPRISGHAAYLIANGQAKSRANRSGGIRKTVIWRTLALSTGEITITAHMASGGHFPKAGMMVRFLDIPAEPSPGTVFEDLHGFKDGGVFSDHLKDVSRKFYGTPIRSFLTGITGILENIKSFIRTGMAEFLTANLPEGSEGQVRRVADRFALIACAGELATLFGITGWPEGEAEESASSCFKAWLQHRGGSGNQERNQILSQVRQFFEAHGSSRFEPFEADDNIRIVNRVGFRKEEDGDTRFFVLPESFKAEIIKGLNLQTATRILIDAGWLIPDPDGTHIPQRESLPGLGRKRVYVFTSAVFGKESHE
ncbi:MAG: DUF927 domain-containing protein [Nitrospiraceae bacterium]|nr:DUF927 domain-containing protein [Nitrospiraceae bacterium]